MEYSGAGGKLIHEKTRSKKSRDTVPLSTRCLLIRRLFSFHAFSYCAHFHEELSPKIINFSYLNKNISCCALGKYTKLQKSSKTWPILTNRPPCKKRPARGGRGQAFFKLQDKINLFFCLMNFDEASLPVAELFTFPKCSVPSLSQQFCE